MKRTTKHGKEAAKPAQQPIFKTPVQELKEFKAKVLAMKHGLLIWVDLDARVSVNQTCQQANEDNSLIRDAYSFWEWTEALKAIVPLEEFGAALDEVRGKVAELWPEYKRLLKSIPDAQNAYNERYNQNCALHKVARGLRDLKEPGRRRELAARDAKIVYLYDVQKYGSFGKIARKLKIYNKHGAPSGAKAYSAYRRYKMETKTKSPPNSDTET